MHFIRATSLARSALLHVLNVRLSLLLTRRLVARLKWKWNKMELPIKLQVKVGTEKTAPTHAIS